MKLSPPFFRVFKSMLRRVIWFWLAIQISAAFASAQQTKDEEVLLFDGRANQTASSNGGAVIWGLEKATWRWWFQGVRYASLSPDGKKVAYVYSNTLHIVDADGQNPKAILSAARLSYPVWSPKGDRIACFTSDEVRPWVSETDNSTPDESNIHRIVYMTNVTDWKSLIDTKIKVVDLEGKVEAEHLYLGPTERLPRSLTWSPDGKVIAYAQFFKHPVYRNTYSSIDGFKPDTGEVYTIYEPIVQWNEKPNGGVELVEVEFLDNPRWSPDGTRIAMDRRHQTKSEITYSIVSISSTGTGMTTMVDEPKAMGTGDYNFPSTGDWSSDGSAFYFTRAVESEITGSVKESTPRALAARGTYEISSNGTVEQINGFVPWSDSQSGPRFLQATVWNPSPKVSLKILLPSSSFLVGDVIAAEVEVTSTFDESVEVSLPIGVLQASDAEILEVDEFEAEAFTLSPEEPSKTFPIKVTVKSYGIADLSSEINYTDEDDEEQSVLKSEEVFVPSLSVTVKALPLIGDKPIVNIKLNEEGLPTDKDGNLITPKVKVVVENLSGNPVTAILQGVDPRARDSSATVGRIETLGEFPMELGSIIKGTPKSKEIELKLNEDGRFEFSALVTGVFDGSQKQFNVTRKGAAIAVGETYPVEVEMEFVRTSTITNQRPDAFFVTPGGEIKIIASVNNLTTNSTLHFKGIEAEKRLNAFGAILTDEAGNLVNPPFAHDHEVDPNSSVILSGYIKTDAKGAPSGSVKWVLPEDAYMVDDETEEINALKLKDFLITTEVDGWLSDENSLRIIQDYSQPLPPEYTGFEYAGLVSGNFTKGTLIGMARWVDDSFDAIGGIGRVAGSVSADPSLLSDALGDGSRFVWEAAEMIHLGWTSMSPNEKDAFILEAVDETLRRAQYLAEAPFDKESYVEAYSFTKDATYGLFGGVSDAYATNDPAQISEYLGSVTGNIAMEVITATLPTPKFTRYVDGAELAKLAEAVDNIRALNQQQKILQSVPAGPVARWLAIDGWGVGGKHLDSVQAAMKKLRIKGYARERAPRSITLSETLDEAVLKPQSMKPKGFSDLDRLMFGGNPPTVLGKDGAVLDLDAITVVMLPPSNALINARLQGQTDEVISAVLARADARRREYAKRFPEFEEYKKDGIPIDFDYKSNDSSPIKPNNPPGSKRNFDYETISQGGTVIHVPKMGNANNELRYITGDVDWIHFCNLDGSPLDSETASKVYEYLEACCGLQHGETVTWINKGQAVFEGKASQIGEYLVGPDQKALLEVTGDGLRAVRVNPKLTRFAKDTRNHLIFFDGGTKSLQEALKAADLENAFAVLFEKLPPRKVILPFLWFADGSNLGEDTNIDGQDWAYSDDPNSVVSRQADDGSLERFDGKNWIPWNPKATPSSQSSSNSIQLFSRSKETRYPVALADGDKLNIAPTTTLAGEVEPGMTVFPITDYTILWAEELEGHVNSWFKVGDLIVIAPGTSIQEVRKIVSLSPFTIDHPLSYAHSEYTVVAVVPDSIRANLRSVESVQRLEGHIILLEDSVTYAFSLPEFGKVIFEFSEDLKAWTPIPLEALIGGELIENEVQSSYPGEPIYIIIDPSGTKRFLRWRESN